LEKQGVVKSYGILTEVDEGMVAQAEHTFLVEDGGATVTTAT
jgi:methionine aminopeptidase